MLGMQSTGAQSNYSFVRKLPFWEPVLVPDVHADVHAIGGSTYDRDSWNPLSIGVTKPYCVEKVTFGREMS